MVALTILIFSLDQELKYQEYILKAKSKGIKATLALNRLKC